MRLRIVSDGTPAGTKLIDADTGEQVNNVIKEVTWKMNGSDEYAEVTLKVVDMSVDLVGRVTKQHGIEKEFQRLCSICGERQYMMELSTTGRVTCDNCHDDAPSRRCSICGHRQFRVADVITCAQGHDSAAQREIKDA